MEDVGIFYGHLVHFTVSCYIFWTFGIVRGDLVYFSRFGILHQEKSGNPGCKQNFKKRLPAAANPPFVQSSLRLRSWPWWPSCGPPRPSSSSCRWRPGGQCYNFVNIFLLAKNTSFHELSTSWGNRELCLMAEIELSDSDQYA
jgi:hypothetical protein